MVDDEPLNLELLEAYLQASGYEVLRAVDGTSALEIVAESPPDLILLDVMLPGKNGYAVCEELKGNDETRFIPIILITALTSLEDKIKGIESGADDFLNKPFNKQELMARVKSLIRVKHINEDLDTAQNIIFTLALAIEAKDPYTRGHSERVADLAAELAKHMGLHLRDQLMIRNAGILHDIGKIGVSGAILNKTETLTEDELIHVRTHSELGEQICRPLRSARAVLPIIRQHGERYDGTGHPDGLAGEEICLGARIVAVADAYDAMTSDRPYRKRMTKEKAIEILKLNAGIQWDPRVVTGFLEMLASQHTSNE